MQVLTSELNKICQDAHRTRKQQRTHSNTDAYS